MSFSTDNSVKVRSFNTNMQPIPKTDSKTYTIDENDGVSLWIVYVSKTKNKGLIRKSSEIFLKLVKPENVESWQGCGEIWSGKKLAYIQMVDNELILTVNANFHRTNIKYRNFHIHMTDRNTDVKIPVNVLRFIDESTYNTIEQAYLGYLNVCKSTLCK